MRATPITLSGFSFVEEKPIRESTAYYIFNKSHRYPYKVENSHFKAKSGMLNLPIVSNGSEADLTRIGEEMIYTSGPIIEMVDLFIGGAVLEFEKHDTAAEVYKRILDHLEMHLTAMRTDPTYRPPPVDDFRHLAEFATAIRPYAQMVDQDIDRDPDERNFESMLPARASLSYRAPEASEEPDVPKSVSQMDAIERFMDMIGKS